MRRHQSGWAVSSLAAILLSACGGGGGGNDNITITNAGGVTRIASFGDSLSDPGAYALVASEKSGGRFTVNSNGAKVWTELVAENYGLPLKPNQIVTDAGATIFSDGTSYAEGGARVTKVSASPIETAIVGLPSPTVLGVKTDTLPCSTPLLPSKFGSNANDPSTVAASITFDANLAGCVVPDAVLTATGKSSLILDSDNAGIGFFVANQANTPQALVTGSSGLTRTGLTTLPVSVQVSRFLASNPKGDGSTLITVLAGANDLFTLAGYISASALPPPSLSPTPNSSAQAIIGVATSLVQSVAALKAAGYSKILVSTLPDLGSTPLAVSQGANGIALFTGMTQIFNGTLKQGLGLLGTGISVFTLDTTFNNAITNPSSIGLTNTSTPACKQSTTGGFQSNPRSASLRTTNSSLFCGTADLVAANADQTYLFADSVHPTPRGHQVIAQDALTNLKAIGWR
jgi:phospholipase/lecithinase/hemolysin